MNEIRMIELRNMRKIFGKRNYKCKQNKNTNNVPLPVPSKRKRKIFDFSVVQRNLSVGRDSRFKT